MTANKARIQISPNPSKIDDSVEIRISGAPSDTWITIKINMRDSLGSEWESFAEVLTDCLGSCDLSTLIPRIGTYACRDAMGLIWSMQWKSNDPNSRTPMTPIQTTLRVLGNGVELTEATWTRYPIAPTVSRFSVKDSGLIGTLYVPKEGGPYPAVVMLGGSEGGLRESSASFGCTWFCRISLSLFRDRGITQTIDLRSLGVFSKSNRLAAET